MNQSRLNRLSPFRPCPRKSGRGFSWAAAALFLGMAVPSALAQTTNHAPVGTSNTVTLAEDSPYVFTAADFGFTDPNDSPPNQFAAVKITTLPAAGTLTSGGNAVTNGQWIEYRVEVTWTARESTRNWWSVASSADGTKLVAAVDHGQLYVSADSGATWTPRETNRNWSSVASSADGTKLVAGVYEGQLYVSTDSGATWTARESNRRWYSVASSADGTKLVAAVQNGQLYVSADSGATWTARESTRGWRSVASSSDGTKLIAAVSGGYLFTSQGEIDLTFTPAPDGYGSPYASFTFQVQDDGGTANGGADLDPTPKTMTLHVTEASPNHAPVGAANTVILAEDTPYVFTAADFGFTDPDDSPPNRFAAVKITSLPAAGTLRSGGSAVTNGQWIEYRDGATWTARESERNWISVASSSDGTKLVAAVLGGQLYVSTDSGATWTPRGDSRNWTSVASSSDGNKLIAAVSGGQLYVSTDSGATWTPRGDSRPWISVASSADGTRLVAAAQNGQLYVSTDSGATWTARESDRRWSSVASSADGTKLVAAALDGLLGGRLYTSTDSGATWTARESERYWWAVASSSDGAKLVAAVMGGQLYVSTDSGAMWTPRETNRNWSSVASSADGTKLVAAVQNGPLYTSVDSGASWTARESNRWWRSVASSSDGTKLVAAVEGGQLYVSTDSGATWTPSENSRAWQSVASSADGTRLVALADQIYTSQDGSDLTFTPAANGYGSPYGSFTFQVQDDGGTAGGGADLDPTPKTMTLDVTAAAHNHAPAGTANTVTALKDTPYAFDAADFGFTDPNDSPPNQFAAVKITSLPAAGTLASGGNAATNGQWISISAAGENWTARETYRGWNSVASSADGTKLIAAVGFGNLYVSTDSGTTWTACETNRLWLSVASSADGTKLVAAGGTQIHVSTDSGTNWTAHESTRNWISVASSADGTKLVAAVQDGQLYVSTDSGANWTARDTNRNWNSVASSADGTKLVAAVGGGQLYVSTDSGTNWTARESNRGWHSVASSADGTKLVAAVYEGQLYVSTDSGATWTARESDRRWYSVASSADGTKLVAAVVGGQLYTSTDSGATWTACESNRDWWAVASSADGNKLIAAVSGGQLYTSQGGLDLTFTPAPDGYGSPYGSFTFQVQDDGGTADGGVDLDPVPKTMTLDVMSTPLWWLADHGITGDFAAAVNGDPDEDGIPTGDEWVMDTDPTNGASFLAFDAVWPLYSNCWVVSTNKEPPNEVVSNLECEVIGHVFQWRASTSRVYTVQWSPIPLGPLSWSDVVGMSGLHPASSSLTVSNGAAGGERGLYRIRVNLPVE